MKHNIKEIKKILEAIEKSVDTEMVEWSDAKPATEEKFDKATEGTHKEMDADPKFDSVKDSGAKKMETKPSFPAVKKGEGKGGATGVKGDGKAKEVKLEAADVEAKLPKDKKIAAKGLREAIEALTGKKVVYVA
jgi:hypothetical protein